MDENAYDTNVFDNCDDGGGDLRLSSDEAGSSQLALHVVSFDTGGDTAETYTLIELDHDDDVVVYIWGDNASDSQPAADSTYGSEAVYPAIFDGVYNHNDNGNDATSNDRHGVDGGSVTYGAGKIGKEAQYGGTGTTDETQFSTNWDISTTNVTILQWINLDSDSEQGAFFQVGTPTNLHGFAYGVGEGTFNADTNATWNGNEALALNLGGSSRWIDTNNNWGTGDFMASFGLDSSGKAIFYKNGAVLDNSDAGAAPAAPTNLGHIGGYHWDGGTPRRPDCDISLTWVLGTTEKTADWQTTAYNNMNDVSDFGTAAAVESGETAAVVPVAMDLTPTAVTATYISVQTAAVVPLATELTPPAVTAVLAQVETAAVVPLATELAPIAPTATFVIEKTAAVVPLVMELVPKAVTATFDSDFVTPSKIAYDPLLDEVLYHIHTWHTAVEDLASTLANKGASLVGVKDSGGFFTASTVEDALQEIAAGVYGEIFAFDSNTTITISGSGIANKVQVTAFDTNGASNIMAPDHTNYHITVIETGKYLCTVSTSAESAGGTSYEAGFGVFKNNGDTHFTNLHAHRNLSGGGGDTGSITMSGIVSLTAADTIEVWVWNETNTNNVIVDDITLSLLRIG